MKKTFNSILICCIMALVLTFSLASCNKSCEHVYDDCADIECNLCGETRDSMHSWKDADCVTPKTCTVCQKTDGEALGHEWTTPDVDQCEVQSTCSRCGATDGENKEHSYDNACDTTCNDCSSTREVSGHVYDNACDVACNECNATRAITHDYSLLKYDETHHWYICSVCERPDGENKATHVYDNDCDTTCNTCGKARTTEHTPNADDGDCTTAITCNACEQVCVAAAIEHSIDSDGKCANCDVRMVAMTVVNGITAYHQTIDDALLETEGSTKESGTLIKLLSNLKISDTIELVGYVTFDLNGKTIDYPYSNYSFNIAVSSYSHANLIDTAGGGQLIGCYGVRVFSNASFYMSGGKIIASGVYGIQVSLNAIAVFEGDVDVESGMYSISASNEAIVRVNGGIYKADYVIRYSLPSEITISGGTFIGSFSDGYSSGSPVQPTLSGGAFSSGIKMSDDRGKDLSDLLAEGYAFFVDGEQVEIAAGQVSLSGNVTVAKIVS